MTQLVQSVRFALRAKGLLVPCLVCALAMGPVAVRADDLPQPTGPVLLTVSGKIDHTNVGQTAAFDLAMLEQLRAVTIHTTTIWSDGPQTFTGVPVVDLLAVIGARGDSMHVTAISDYFVHIPASDWVEGGPIIAYMNNGELMSLRDKGPLRVIYPYDGNPDYQTEVAYSRSIWQLDRINIE